MQSSGMRQVGAHELSHLFSVKPMTVASNVVISFSLHEFFMESLDCCES